MSEAPRLCEGCPTNPPCATCPTRNVRPGRPAPVAQRAVRKERPPLDRSKMGFGNHDWEYINPQDIPTDFGPPGGVMRRDFDNAFNRAHPDTDVDLDVISRPGAVIETTAPDFFGQWIVSNLPLYHEGVVYARLMREEDGEVVKVPCHMLGIVAERYTNLYEDTVVTKRLAGGKANRDTREALTQKSEESY